MARELTVAEVRKLLADGPRLSLSEAPGETYYIWPKRTGCPVGVDRLSFGIHRDRWTFEIGEEAAVVLLGWYQEDIDGDALESGVLADKLEEVRDYALAQFDYPAAAVELYDAFIECLRLRFRCGNLPPEEREQLALEAWEAREARLGRAPRPSEPPSQ